MPKDLFEQAWLRQQQFAADNIAQLPLGMILAYMLLAFVLVVLVSYVYRRTHSGVAYTQSFNFAMIMVALVICMVMMTIQSNIALSIGLVGSLSIIRFRSVIRDMRDMAFLFMAVAIGLACGSFNHRLALAGTAIICGLCLATQKLRFSATSSAEYVLIFRTPGAADTRGAVEQCLRDTGRWYRLRSMHETGEGRMEYTYVLALRAGQSAEDLARALRAQEGIEQISILSPDNDLDI